MQEGVVVRHLSKTFGGQRALDDVSLTILRGEVHGLVGQNGSGKSTLIKILAGYHDPDPGGHLEINGHAVKLPLRPGAFRMLGLSFVHQDLGLLPSLTVVENFRAGKISTTSQWRIRWGVERKRAEKAFERYGLMVDPSAKKVEDLPSVQRALLAIIRAVEDMAEANTDEGHPKGLLVLDEPTVFLPKTDTDQLFKVVRDIAASGASVLFVSHDLDEALAVCDRVTVLRDGHVAGTVVSTETSTDALVELIIGRGLGALTQIQRSEDPGRDSKVAVKELPGPTIRGVSFDLREGEILGLTGLVGSGFEEVPYLMFGATSAKTGHLTVGGVDHDLTKMRPSRAIEIGMALLPADRQDAGGVGSLTVEDNLMLQVLGRYFKTMWLHTRQLLQDSRNVLKEHDVRPAQPNMDFQALSGGNQQKVLLAKWLQTGPVLLLVHEPNQGVDVGARHQVYEMLRMAASGGMSVVCASSDYEQLSLICDRVLVFASGELCDELVGEEISKDRIAERCYGGGRNSCADQIAGD